MKDVQKLIHETNEKKKRKLEGLGNEFLRMECHCCFNNECLLDETITCDNGHTFWYECIEKASEEAIGNGEVRLSCLEDCKEDFTFDVLQNVMDQERFQKWLKQVQKSEIEKAGKENLVECPFCYYCSVMKSTAEENKNF